MYHNTLDFRTFSRIARCLPFFLACSFAAAQQSTTPSDENSLKGDHVRLTTNFSSISAPGDTKQYCAPAGSRMAISDDDGTSLYVRFLVVSDESDKLLDPSDTDALASCPKGADGRRVNTFTAYKIAKSNFEHLDYKRSGISFGALVVPFKFRLGSSKELISSSTVAPFIGFRTAWLTFGLTFTPVVAAGLSVVPVANATSGTIESKSAYTFAAGFRLTSTKNDKFNAGLLLGHDFLNKSDRQLDPAVAKPWLSFYLGYAL